MYFFNQKRLKVSLILMGAIFLSIGYNNCSSVKFQETADSIVSRLNTNGAIHINNNSEFTNSKNVNLTIEHNSAKFMYITNDPTCNTGGTWQPYETSRPWVLNQANSEARVFGKFKESALDINSPESECFVDAIIHDDIPPVLTSLSSPPRVTKESSTSIQFDATDSISGSGLSTIECFDKNSSPVSECLKNMSINNIAEGNASLTIYAFDRAGNKSAPLVQSWFVDRTIPKVEINSKPSDRTNQTGAEFGFSGTDNFSTALSYECKIDGLAYSSCVSPKSFSKLSNGNHDFYLRAQDEAGNFSSEEKYSWDVDLNSPTVVITKRPDSYTKEKTGQFEFTGTDNGAPIGKFDCRLDGGAAVSCTSPYSTVGSLSEGRHDFTIVGFDSVGNSSSPATYSWTVDLTSPEVHITSNPRALTNENIADFVFSVTDSSSISLIECSLDGAKFADCQSHTVHYASIAEGDHSFVVRATDAAGNQTTKAYSWTVDLTAPAVKLSSNLVFSQTLPMTAENAAEIIIQAADNLPGPIAILCHLDNDAYAVCNPKLTSLPDGSHTYYAKAIDAAGNASTVATYSWTIDSSGPAINFSQIPLNLIGTADTATVQFAVTDDGSGVGNVTCGLAGAEVPCTSAELKTFSALAVGSYTFSVTASDKLGNRSTNSVNWNVQSSIMNRVISQSIIIGATSKADILIVIDNSGSMLYEQASMASRFKSFLDTFKNLDWQLAIVTTDVDEDKDLKDGRFVKFNSAALSNPYILTSAHDYTAANSAFSSTIQRPANEGSGNEQGIAATYRAIERGFDTTNDPVNTPNKNFFRSGSALAALVVTDADETAPNGTQTKNTPQGLVDLVQAKMPGKTFLYHSIIVKSGDAVCKDDKTKFNNGSTNLNEGYGTSYESISNITGGIIGTVCATDYTSQLTSMGNAVADLVKSVTLECLPLDLNSDGKPDITVTLQSGAAAPKFTVTGLKLTFSAALPLGSHTVKYNCLK